MVTIAALKSAIAWIWTWVINDFVTASGVLSVFMTVATINVAIYLVFIPFYSMVLGLSFYTADFIPAYPAYERLWKFASTESR